VTDGDCPSGNDGLVGETSHSESTSARCVPRRAGSPFLGTAGANPAALASGLTGSIELNGLIGGRDGGSL
jgi:hypothetical protein